MHSWADLDFDPFGNRFDFALASLDFYLAALLQIVDPAILIRLRLPPRLITASNEFASN